MGYDFLTDYSFETILNFTFLSLSTARSFVLFSSFDNANVRSLFSAFLLPSVYTVFVLLSAAALL